MELGVVYRVPIFKHLCLWIKRQYGTFPTFTSENKPDFEMQVGCGCKYKFHGPLFREQWVPEITCVCI